MHEYLNDPEVRVLVDRIPRKRDIIFREIPTPTGVFVYGELDGYVEFFHHTPTNQNGYGGAKFVVNVKTDFGPVIEKSYTGPWSSRPGVLHELTSLRVVPVSLQEETYHGTFVGHLTRWKAMEVEALIGHKFVEQDSHGELNFAIPKEKASCTT
jgi:hypothetical protein